MKQHLKNKAFDHVLDSSILVFFIYYFYKFYSQLVQTYFWSDETMHAYVASLIYENKTIPTYLPKIYGHFMWTYQTFFHTLAALTMPLWGLSGLKYFNLGLLFVFFIAFYTLIRKYYGRFEAGTACLLLSFSGVIGECTVRFMVELLSGILFFFSFFFLILALRKDEERNETAKFFTAGSGLATGLLLLTKHTGFVVLFFYILLLAWFYFAKKSSLRTMLTVVVISLAMSTPYYIWQAYNEIETVSWIVDKYFGDSWRTTAVRRTILSWQRYDSAIKEFAVHFYRGNGFLVSLSALAPLYYLIKTRARDYPHNYFFLMLIYLVVMMIAYHITFSRHTITLLPLLVFIAAYASARIFDVRAIQSAVLVMLLAGAVYSAYSMPDYRNAWNAPPDFRYMVQMIREDVSEGRVLTINHIDTVMYTEREVIWPHIHVKSPTMDLFNARDPDEFNMLLKKYNTSHVLVWRRFIGPNYFMFGRYPAYMVRNCIALTKKGKMTHMGSYGEYMLFKVID